MKRRIRFIFWLMVACVGGINGFQAYWLYTTYRLTASQFARTAREALASVVQRHQLGEARQLVDRDHALKDRLVVFQNTSADGRFDRVLVQHAAAGPAPPAAHAPSDPKRVTEQGAARRVGPVTEIRGHKLGGPLPPLPAPGSNKADTLVRNISKILLTNWAGGRPVDLRQLAATYHQELRLRGADVPLALDTLRIPRPQAGGRPRPAKAPGRAGFSLQTPPVALNPFRDLYVRASLQPPAFYILRRMAGLLAGSGLLLALTTGCFWLMLSTILQQKKLSEVKNDFINNMTHELKTPLATVSAAVEALQDFGALQDAQKTQAYLRICRHELQRLSDLVEKVLRIAVDERQALVLHPEPVHPAELVQEAVARHQLRMPKPIRFEVQVPATDSVRLDRLHISNVINNLIDNAIKYSHERVTIAIRGWCDATGWRLTVTDDGIGIPGHYQEAVFDRFFRVPTGNLHPVKGFGLGLYYVRQVVERHGGHIAVRSTASRGSEFALWLPLNPTLT